MVSVPMGASSRRTRRRGGNRHHRHCQSSRSSASVEDLSAFPPYFYM